WQKKVGTGFSGPVVAGGKLVLHHRLGSSETVESFDAASGKTLWSFSYPTRYVDDFGFDNGPRATPAIDSGRVYTVGAEGMVSCGATANGEKLWSVDTKST